MKTILFLLLISSSFAFAQELDFLKSEKDFQIFHSNLKKLVVEIEANQKFPSGKIYEGKSVYIKTWMDLIFSQVYADLPAGFCLFGGWPSLKRRGLCKPPWMYDNHSSLSQFTPRYDSNHYCGPKDSFRCNPVLFGPGEDGKGKCIKFKKIQNVTKICAEASKDDNVSILKELLTQEDFRNQYIVLVKGLTDFCANTHYSSCKFLKGKVEAQVNFLCDNNEKIKKILGISEFNRLFSAVKNVEEKTRPAGRETAASDDEELEESNEDGDDYQVDLSSSEIQNNLKPIIPWNLSTTLPDSGEGYYTYDPSGRGKFLNSSPGVIQRIQLAGKLNKAKGITAGVGHISRDPDIGKGTPGHTVSHKDGTDIDLRLINKNKVAQSGTVESSHYDRGNTLEMIKSFIKADPYNLDGILINDPILRKQINDHVAKVYKIKSVKVGGEWKPLARYCAGHANHVHLTYSNTGKGTWR